MAGPDRRMLAAPLVMLLAGCASAAKPPAKEATPAPVVAPQTVTPDRAPTPSTVEDPVAAPIRGNQPVVIDEGNGNDNGAQTLGSAAAAERERRLSTAASTLVINNKNLAEHATGKLTYSQAKPLAPAPAAAAPAPAKGEDYWRQRVHGLRQQWALAVDSIGELEARAASLRTRFYAQDDPYVRDGEIKPAWDRALENLQTARERAHSLEDELARVLEDGRQTGALPGWLRDGIELEPLERPYDRPEHQVHHDDGNLVREPEELGQPPHR